MIALDPEHVEAGRPLADLYFDDQQWAELSPVIDMLCRKVGQLHADPKRAQRALLPRRAAAPTSSATSRRRSATTRPRTTSTRRYLPTLIGRADLLFKMQDWDSAGKIYQTILVQHRDGQDEADVVRIYNRLGMVRQALGERKKALNMFEKALEIDPTHRETLQAVIDLQSQQGDWEAVVHAKRGLMQTADEQREDRAARRDRRHLSRASCRTRRRRRRRTSRRSRSRPKITSCSRSCSTSTSRPSSGRRRSRRSSGSSRSRATRSRKGAYYHAAATLCRDELKSLDEAVDYYDCALDSFFAQPEQLDEQQLPRALKSFEAIDKVLTTKRDWKAQERAYRDMIKRLPTAAATPMFHKLQVGLFDGLGEIYRSRLKQYQSATAGVRDRAADGSEQRAPRRTAPTAPRSSPSSTCVAGPDYADKAVEQHMRMLRNEPFKYDSYKALAQIYMDTHQYDKNWCVCNTLAFLKKADPDELAVLRAVQAARPRQGQERDERRDAGPSSSHPDENRYISAIFGACWQGVAAMKAFPHKDFGIKRKDRRQLQGDPLMFSKLFYYVAQVLNVPLPEVYLVDDNKAADIQLANAIEKNELCPSFVVRPHLLQGKNEREVAFLSARRLDVHAARVLPAACCCRRTPSSRSSCSSAIVMLQPRFPVPPDIVAARAAVPARDAEAHAAARARAARRGRPALHPGRARDQPREVGPRGRRGLASRRLRGVRRPRGRRAHGRGRAGRRRRPAGQGQDQRARPVLDQRGVLRRPRADGPDDRGLISARRKRAGRVLGAFAVSDRALVPQLAVVAFVHLRAVRALAEHRACALLRLAEQGPGRLLDRVQFI